MRGTALCINQHIAAFLTLLVCRCDRTRLNRSGSKTRDLAGVPMFPPHGARLVFECRFSHSADMSEGRDMSDKIQWRNLIAAFAAVCVFSFSLGEIFPLLSLNMEQQGVSPRTIGFNAA